MSNKIETMKAAELSIAERKAGLSLATLEDPNYPKADLLIALGWVIAKREDPSLTFEKYGEQYTMDDITKQLGIDKD